MTDTYTFDAFGNLIAAAGTTPNNYLYSGEQFDNALHLYNLRARYLNPSTGAFLTRDPYEGIFRDPNTLHPYAYVNANPVNAIDPTGLDELLEYSETSTVVRFGTHGLDHLIAEGYELSQAEVEAYVEQLVREFLAETAVNHGALFDIPFAMAQLGNVPWAARVFIVTDALISVSTYFPIR
ncbi:MAG: RHS repeat-associated core domain-containing protein [Terriglobales bacterium]